jgi:hypothetical protein
MSVIKFIKGLRRKKQLKTSYSEVKEFAINRAKKCTQMYSINLAYGEKKR